MFLDTSISELIKYDSIREIEAFKSINEAIALMSQNNLPVLIVNNLGKFYGLITVREVMDYYAQSNNEKFNGLQHWANRTPICFKQDDSVNIILEKIQDSEEKFFPVLSSDNEDVSGVFTREKIYQWAYDNSFFVPYKKSKKINIYNSH